MKLSDAEIKASTSRLKRARGQLDAVIRMMEEGRDCEEIVTQLSAAHKATSRASFQVFVTMMKRCVDPAEPDTPEPKDLERMFLSFA